MPRPEDAFDDENAPAIPDLESSRDSAEEIGEDLRRMHEERVADRKEAEQFGKKVSTDSVEDFRQARRNSAAAVGLIEDGGGDSPESELLDEVRAIRSLLESVLNS